ncbi:MAG: biotin/lipoyl-binding protein, partial [Chloroflexi bacterium]|nr:biotin/lipoyl-binding protein [Chloroflexota bacterium]
MSRIYSRRYLVGVVVILVVVAAVYFVSSRTILHAQQAAPRTAKVTLGSLIVSVGASGSLLAQQDVNLTFQSGGTVAEIPVKQGDHVVTGTVLMRLDRSQLQLQVTQAQANLSSAQAKLDQTKSGATQKDLDTAQAQVRSAQANYEQTVQGSRPEDIAAAEAQLRSALAKLDALKNPNPQDVAAAQTQVDSAQAKLDALLRGALPQDIASAQAKVQQAEQNLAQTQASGAAAKEQARLAMETAADNLRSALNTWNTAYWDWQNAQNNKTDPGDNAEPE